MRPHTAALIAAYLYAKYRDNQASQFLIEVEPSKLRYFTIKVENFTERGATLEVSGRWSCLVRASVSGVKVTFEHGHKVGARETFEDHKTSINNGVTVGNELYKGGYFKSTKITSDYKHISFEGPYKGKTQRYEVKINTVLTLK
jgi:hypothetical protein